MSEEQTTLSTNVLSFLENSKKLCERVKKNQNQGKIVKLFLIALKTE